MDLFEKLNAGLEPLGGGLFVDVFVAARQAELARLAAASRKTARESRAVAPEQDARAEEAAPQGGPAPPDGDPGAVPQSEMDAFLSRDRIEGADDAEIQEFLKERAGFDPADLE